MTDCSLTGLGIRRLAQGKIRRKLEKLTLNWNKIKDEEIESLGKFNSLVSLRLVSIGMTFEGLNLLS